MVGGSSLLSVGSPDGALARLRGFVDAAAWGASAGASLAAGQLFGGGGFRAVALAAGVLAALPLAVLFRRRGAA